MCLLLKCSKCQKVKELDKFNKDCMKIKRFGRRHRCKKCENNIYKLKIKNKPDWYKRKKEKKRNKYHNDLEYRQKELGRSKKYRQSENGKIIIESRKGTEKQKLTQKKYDQSKKGKTRHKRYRATEKSRLCEIKKHHKRRSTIRGKLRDNISGNIYDRLKARRLSKNGKSTLDFLPYTIDKLKIHLEKQFLPKMTWDNYGSEWHIDHIVPDSLWDYKSTDDYEFQKCWSLQNLRPMWAKDNCSKGNNLFWDLENPDKGYEKQEIIEWFCNYKNIEIPYKGYV